MLFRSVVRASLADQSLAIALGANLPSPAGDPIATLVAVRPLIEGLLLGLQPDAAAPGWLRWSPLFSTVPMGGPPGQPSYINAVLLADVRHQPNNAAALQLLERLQEIEARMGKAVPFRNGPRVIDLDLVLYGRRVVRAKHLAVPHPRARERRFVLLPLSDLVDPESLLGQTSAADDAAVCVADVCLHVAAPAAGANRREADDE